MSEQRPTYTVRLQPMPDRDGVPGIVRLRRFLKAALRGYGLRCVHVSEERSTVSGDKRLSPETVDERKDATHDHG